MIGANIVVTYLQTPSEEDVNVTVKVNGNKTEEKPMSSLALIEVRSLKELSILNKEKR